MLRPIVVVVDGGSGPLVFWDVAGSKERAEDFEGRAWLAGMNPRRMLEPMASAFAARAVASVRA